MIENKKSNPIADLRDGFGDRSNIQDRINTQQARIDQGIRSGELTRREADMVQDNLNFIKQQHSSFRGNDGMLGPIERDRLHDLLDRNSWMIENKKHNPVGSLRR
jgi:predicted ribosome quality control (RQC) complex YloA/Tae2 family protein